jgi:hypothetical protein
MPPWTSTFPTSSPPGQPSPRASAKRPSREHGTTYAHGASGNRVAESSSGVTKTFDHDAQGRLRGATVGGVAISYVVDGAARRLGRPEGGATTHQWLFRDDFAGRGRARWSRRFAMAVCVRDRQAPAGCSHRRCGGRVPARHRPGRLVAAGGPGERWRRVAADAARRVGRGGGRFRRGGVCTGAVCP